MSAIFTRKWKLESAVALVAFLACLAHVILAEEDCGPPPEKPNARHNATGDTFPHRTLVYYTCQRGFYQKGYPAVVCNKGTWYDHPQAPFTCALKTCKSPGLIENGEREGFVFSVGATVKYTCYEGYEIKGSAVRMCLASTSWSGKKTSCVPVRCPRLSPPRHGKIQSAGLEYGSTARVTCDEGYRLIGPETRSCQADKTWSGDDSSCDEIECKLPTIESGSVAVETPIKYGMIAIFSCDVGMTLVGKKTAVCVEDGDWSQTFPKCIDTCQVRDVTNGWVRQLNEGYFSYARYTDFHEDQVESGMSLYVKCDWGYSLSPEANTYDGYRKMTCVEGTWDSEPKCKPKSCTQTPSQLYHGLTQYDGLEHGSRIRYACDPGYTLSSYQNRTCEFGRWTGYKPWCKTNYCPHPKDLPEGMVLKGGEKSRYDHDDVVRLQCSNGYSPSVDGLIRELTCYNTTWKSSGDLQCERVPCYYEPTKHEEIISKTDTLDGKFQHNSRLEIKCKRKRKFRLEDGVSKATCQHGEWEPRVPRCEAESCGLHLSVPNGRITYPEDEDTVRMTEVVPHRGKAELVCDPGYRVANGNTSLCVYGSWKAPKPVACNPAPCPGYDDWGRAVSNPVPDDEWRQVVCPRGYHIDQLSIDGEFLFLRNATTKCTLGEWQPVVPECKPDPCKLPPLENVDMCYENGTCFVDVIVLHDTNVTFSCAQGYVWENETTDVTDISLTCQSGQLVGTLPPKCIPDGTGCMDPGDIQNANKTSERRADYGYYPSGEMLAYECHKGFLADGISRNQEIFCLGNGTWSDVLYNCTALTCDKPQITKDRSYSPVKELYLYNETVTFSCEDPKIIAGSAVLTCTEDGQWDGWEPDCKVPQCPDLHWPTNGRRVGNSRQVGDTVSFECNAGFSVSGSQKRTCQANKKWDGETTSCVAEIDKCIIPEEGRLVRSVYRDADGSSLEASAGDSVKEGSVMVSRCERFNDLFFTGDHKRECERGQWIGVEPKCKDVKISDGIHSLRYYQELSKPNRGISILDEGHLEIKMGSTVSLTCQFGEEQDWSSINGLHSADMVRKPISYYGRRGEKLVSSKLIITNADEHHSDSYFCSRKSASIPTATFTIKVI